MEYGHLDHFLEDQGHLGSSRLELGCAGVTTYSGLRILVAGQES